MTMNNPIPIKELIGDAKTIGIAGHIRPDGDCIGSCMTLYNYIEKNFPDIQVKVYLEKIKDKFLFIKNSDKIDSNGYDGTKYDLFFSLDCADLERLGLNKEFFEHAKRTACIDHHISNGGYADYNYILPNASSACEVLYDLLDVNLFDKSIAEPMYTGIAHDSGVFRFQSTTSKTMNVAGKMLDFGINANKILEETYYKKTYAQSQVAGRLQLESVRFMDNRCIFAYATTKLMDFYGVTTKDLDSVVAQLRNIEGIEVAIFMYQIGEMKYKVSMRSQDLVDVSVIASYFGGGGHVRAAGFDTVGDVHDIINNISEQIEKQMP
ncbi:DHH family phosphoesterase [Eubacterium sp.]